MVPAKTTPAKLIRPCAAQYAAGGITNSLGTGKIVLSIAMSTTTPAYPQSRTHPNQSKIKACID
jgi:hypothetical protein